MMRILFCISFVFIFSCNLSAQKAKYEPKVKVGCPQKLVKKHYGIPYTANDTMDVYSDFGFITVYTPQEKVKEIIFGWFVGGKHFSGLIYGIKLGDTYPKCERIWGEKTGEAVQFKQYYEVTFHYKKYIIKAEFWSEAGSDPDFGGDYDVDILKRIRISKR